MKFINLTKSQKPAWLSQAEASELLHVTQPRISELMTGRIGKFKVDVLVKYLSRLGVKVNLLLEPASKIA